MLLGQKGSLAVITQRRLEGDGARDAKERIELVVPETLCRLRGFEEARLVVKKVRFVPPPAHLDLKEHLPAMGAEERTYCHVEGRLLTVRDTITKRVGPTPSPLALALYHQP